MVSHLQCGLKWKLGNNFFLTFLLLRVSEAFFLCSSANDPKRKTLSKELEEEENILKQCIEKLNSVEASRVALVSQLKEALNEQVSDNATIFLMSNEFLIIQQRL